MNKAIYPGSFDPFTYGHMDTVRKAAKLFDEVYILIGVNSKKKRNYDTEAMKAAIEQALLDESITNGIVCVYEGLVAEFARDNGIGYMIRGLRNNMDYNYEENIAEVNKLMNPDMETVYFRADNSGISSSMVRELLGYGRDVSKYVPAAVCRILK